MDGPLGAILIIRHTLGQGLGKHGQLRPNFILCCCLYENNGPKDLKVLDTARERTKISHPCSRTRGLSKCHMNYLQIFKL